MRRLIIISSSGLTLLFLAVLAWGLWTVVRAPLVMQTAGLPWAHEQQQDEERKAKAAADDHPRQGGRSHEAAPRIVPAEAPTAVKADEERKAIVRLAASERRKVEEQQELMSGPPSGAPLPPSLVFTPGPLPPPSPLGVETRAAKGGDTEIKKMEQARQVLEQLPKGKIVLDAPKAMKVGDTRAVYANVGINVPIELLQKHSRPTDQSHQAALSVSSEMVATLTGPAFAITPTTPEQQGVAEGYPTVWSWNVEAKQEGEQELEATLYVLLPNRQRIDSDTHKIGVSVKPQSWTEWLKSSKEEVEAVHVIAITLGSAVMAVLGWLGLSYGRRRVAENRHQTNMT